MIDTLILTDGRVVRQVRLAPTPDGDKVAFRRAAREAARILGGSVEYVGLRRDTEGDVWMAFRAKNEPKGV